MSAVGAGIEVALNVSTDIPPGTGWLGVARFLLDHESAMAAAEYGLSRDDVRRWAYKLYFEVSS